MKTKIGLDLGTGKCCVAIANNGKLIVLPDARGNKTTPSFFAVNESRTLTGSDARDQASINSDNTAYGIKSILGRTLDDPVVDRILNPKVNVALPFPPCLKGDDGLPKFQFEYSKKKKLSLRPEQITALLIDKMKSIAEKYLDRSVHGAVISVPASFNTAQRQATLDAAHIAGLRNSTLVNSTTAAAVAYWDHHRRKDDCIAVVDIGAGSVNFAIVSIENGDIFGKESYGDCKVGGNDFDLHMMSALIKKFNEQNSVEFHRSTKCLMRLRFATETLKKQLSLLPTANIRIEALCGEVDMSMTFTRKEMVACCAEVLDVIQSGLSRLKDSELWKGVRCAVLVGGSTRIPAVQDMISSVLNIPLDQSLNKDEAIACGAALMGSGSALVPQVEDVLGRRIWRKSSKSSNFVIFDISTTLPNDVVLDRSFSYDVEVLENVMPLGSENPEIFTLSSIRGSYENYSPNDGGLIFSVTENGIFAADKIRNGKCVALLKQSLNFQVLSECIESHRAFLRRVKELEENEIAVNDLEGFCLKQREFVEKNNGNSKLLQKIDNILQWLEDTPDATKEQCGVMRSQIGPKIRSSEPNTEQETSNKENYYSLTFENEDERPSDGDHSFGLPPSVELRAKTPDSISYPKGSNDERGNTLYKQHSKKTKISGPYSYHPKKNTQDIPQSTDLDRPQSQQSRDRSTFGRKSPELPANVPLRPKAGNHTPETNELMHPRDPVGPSAYSAPDHIQRDSASCGEETDLNSAQNNIPVGMSSNKRRGVYGVPSNSMSKNGSKSRTSSRSSSRSNVQRGHRFEDSDVHQPKPHNDRNENQPTKQVRYENDPTSDDETAKSTRYKAVETKETHRSGLQRSRKTAGRTAPNDDHGTGRRAAQHRDMYSDGDSVEEIPTRGRSKRSRAHGARKSRGNRRRYKSSSKGGLRSCCCS